MKRFAFLLPYEPLLLLLLLPVGLFATAARLPLLLLIPCLWLVRWRVTGRLFPETSLDDTLLMLLLAVLISIYPVIYYLEISVGKIGGILFGIGVYYGVVAFSRQSKQRLGYALLLFVAAGGGIALLALVGTQWNFKIPGLTGLILRLQQLVPRLGGLFHANQIGGTLLWTTLPAAAAAMYSWWGEEERPFGLPRWPVFCFLTSIAGISSIVIFLTQSRAALAGLGVGGLLLLGFYYRPFGRSKSYRALIGAMVLGAALIGIFLQQNPADADLGGFSGSLATRQETWERAIYAIEDFGLTGIGLNNFRYATPILYPYFIIDARNDIAHAHNQFLHTGAELGILGLVAYLFLWGQLSYNLGRAFWRQQSMNRSTVVRFGCAAALAAYLIYGLVDTVALGAKPGFLFWYLIALTVVVTEPAN